jgi:murein DD-endopeptidase MepM/ murein hydrolase activator NlpD
MQIPNSIPGAQLPARSIEEYRGRTDPGAIKAVAQEMEAMFAYELLKAMRATSDASSKSGLGPNTYTSLFDMELSKLIAKRGIGLKDMLLKGIEKKAATTEKNAGEKTVATERGGDAVGAASMMKQDATIQQPLPANKGRISSGFGIRHDPFTGAYKFHHGLDVAAPEGSEIRPLKQGNVIFSGEQKGYGNVVIIDHGDGFVTKYAHNQINLAQEGDVVTSSTVIARVGNTGKTTGPHTHFEVIYNGKDIDPAAVFGRNS